jgi:hypothetical protein
MPNVCDFVLFQNVVGDAEQHLAVDKAIPEDVTVDTKRLSADLSSSFIHHMLYNVLHQIKRMTCVKLTHWQTISTDHSETGILFLSPEPSTFETR